MKHYTFITPFGVFTSIKPSLKEAFTEVCTANPRVTMATLNGGSISNLDNQAQSNVQVLSRAA